MTNRAFLIVPESNQSFCIRTYRSLFWTCCACTKDRNTYRYVLWSALHVCERHEAEEICLKFHRGTSHLQSCEPNRAFLNQGAICKSAWREREGLADSTDCTPAKLSSLIAHLLNWLYWLHTCQTVSTDCTPAKLTLLLAHVPNWLYCLHTCQTVSYVKQTLQMFKKEYHEKWPFITIGDFCMWKVTLVRTQKFAELLSNDWTGGQ